MMSVYLLVLLAHVLAAAVLLAGSLLAFWVRREIVAAPSLDILRSWLDFDRRSTRTNPVAALTVLATGIYLGSSGWWAEPWFYVAVAAWVGNSVLAQVILHPTAAAVGRAAAQVSAAAIPPDLDALRRSRRWAVTEAIMRAIDAAMLCVMFAKPPLVASITVVLGAVALSVAVEALDHRQSRIAPTGNRGLSPAA